MRSHLLLALMLILDDAPPIPGPLKPPPAAEFVVVPLRVHVLTAPDLPDVDCGLTDADVRRILGKVNAIWHQAGVHWGLDALVREPAANPGRFKATLRFNGEDDLGAYRLLAPEGSRTGRGMDVYYLHRFPINGVYLGDRMAFVQDLARLRPVPGGLDEPIPRVTAHELGHALGLPHRQDRTNLLASGNNGTTLDESEAAHARAEARATPGALAVPDLRKQVDEALAKGDTDQARRLLTWLAEVPGGGAEEARQRLEALPPGHERSGPRTPRSVTVRPEVDGRAE